MASRYLSDRKDNGNQTLTGPDGIHNKAKGKREFSPPEPCRPERWERHGVVLDPQKRGGSFFVENFTSPAEPLKDGCWRIWYSTFSLDQKPLNIAVARGIPGQPLEQYEATFNSGDVPDGPLTIGNLPENWFPTQPVHIRLFSGKHRLYFWAHGPDVVRYLAAESDDGQRYRVLNPDRPCLYHPVDRAVDYQEKQKIYGLTAIRRKHGGKLADEPSAPPHLISNDATNPYQLPDGSFEMFSVGFVSIEKSDRRYVAHDNAAGLVRVIDRYTSEDGIHWPIRQRVLEPDGGDPTDLQFYHLAVTYTKQGRVGLLGHYRTKEQTMDVEWCFSFDGLKWHRTHRYAWLKRGAEGQPDSYGIYPPHSLVFHEHKWWFFYTGVNYAHNLKHAHGEPRSVIMLATTRSIFD